MTMIKLYIQHDADRDHINTSSENYVVQILLVVIFKGILLIVYYIKPNSDIIRKIYPKLNIILKNIILNKYF